MVHTNESLELLTYIDNDYPLHRQKHAIELNQAKKLCKRVWQKSLSEKGFRYVADEAARKYAKEYGMGRGAFSVSDRKAVAKSLARDFIANVNACRKRGPGSAGCNDLPPETYAALKKCEFVRRARRR